jgi:hypothetical protein
MAGARRRTAAPAAMAASVATRMLMNAIID